MKHYYENPDGLTAKEILELDVKTDADGKESPAGTVGGVRLLGDKTMIAEVFFFADASDAAIAESSTKLDKAGLRIIDSAKGEAATRRKAKVEAAPAAALPAASSTPQ